MCQVTVPLALFVRICGNGSVERVEMVVSIPYRKRYGSAINFC